MEVSFVKNMCAPENSSDPLYAQFRDDWSHWVPYNRRRPGAVNSIHELHSLRTLDDIVNAADGRVLKDLPRSNDIRVYCALAPAHGAASRLPAPRSDDEAAERRIQVREDETEWHSYYKYLVDRSHSSDSNELHPWVALEHERLHLLPNKFVPVGHLEEIEVWTDASLDEKTKQMASSFWAGDTKYVIAHAPGTLPSACVTPSIATDTPCHGSSITKNSDDINVGEMKAVLLALLAYRNVQHVHVYTDSAYTLHVFESIHKLYWSGNEFDPPTRRERITDKQGRRTREMRMLEELMLQRWARGAQVTMSKVHAHLLDGDEQQDSTRHERRMDEMRKQYGDRTAHVLAGNRLVDLIAKNAASRDGQHEEPKRTHSRFDDPYVLYTADKPKNRFAWLSRTTNLDKIYWHKIEHEWTKYWTVKQRANNAQQKPQPVLWASDDKTDTKHMSLLWKSHNRKLVQLHTFRDRMCRKELPLREKIHTRINDATNGEFWRQVYSKRGLAERYSSAMCPTGCGHVDRDNHFLECAQIAHDERALATRIADAIVELVDDKQKHTISGKLRSAKAYDSTDWFNAFADKKWLRMGILPCKLAETLTRWRVKWSPSHSLNDALREVQSILIEDARRKWHLRCKAMVDAERPLREAAKRERKQRKLERREKRRQDKAAKQAADAAAAAAAAAVAAAAAEAAAAGAALAASPAARPASQPRAPRRDGDGDEQRRQRPASPPPPAEEQEQEQQRRVSTRQRRESSRLAGYVRDDDDEDRELAQQLAQSERRGRSAQRRGRDDSDDDDDKERDSRAQQTDDAYTPHRRKTQPNR
jgi:hypothetical protein